MLRFTQFMADASGIELVPRSSPTMVCCVARTLCCESKTPPSGAPRWLHKSSAAPPNSKFFKTAGRSFFIPDQNKATVGCRVTPPQNRFSSVVQVRTVTPTSMRSSAMTAISRLIVERWSRFPLNMCVRLPARQLSIRPALVSFKLARSLYSVNPARIACPLRCRVVRRIWQNHHLKCCSLQLPIEYCRSCKAVPTVSRK